MSYIFWRYFLDLGGARETFARLGAYYPGGLRESKQSSDYDYFAFEGTSVNFYYDASEKIIEETAVAYYGERTTAENVWGINGLLKRTTQDYYDDYYSTPTTEYPVAGYRGDILSNFEDYRCFYDAYGNERYDKVSDNPFGYCGEYTDTETGFVYLRGRYYNPSIGRFISEDAHWNVNNMIYGDNQKIENVIAVKEEFATISYNENKVSVELNDENTLTINENLLGMINLSLRENSALTDELNATYNAYSAFEVIKKPDFEAIMQSTNLYMYCIGNPMNFMDPSGWSTTSKVLSTISAGLAIIGGALVLFVPDPVATKVGGYLTIAGGVTEVIAIWTD